MTSRPIRYCHRAVVKQCYFSLLRSNFFDNNRLCDTKNVLLADSQWPGSDFISCFPAIWMLSLLCPSFPRTLGCRCARHFRITYSKVFRDTPPPHHLRLSFQILFYHPSLCLEPCNQAGIVEMNIATLDCWQPCGSSIKQVE